MPSGLLREPAAVPARPLRRGRSGQERAHRTGQHGRRRHRAPQRKHTCAALARPSWRIDPDGVRPRRRRGRDHSGDEPCAGERQGECEHPPAHDVLEPLIRNGTSSSLPSSLGRGIRVPRDPARRLRVSAEPFRLERGGRWTHDGVLIGWIRQNSARLVAAAALVAVLGGVALAALDHHRPADWLWAATTAMLLVPLTWSVLRSLLRGDVGVDAIALVSMAGALALGEYLAGAVVALMLAGGNALEESANRPCAPRADQARRAGAEIGAWCAAATSSSSFRSTKSSPTRSCSCAPERSCRWTGWS